MRFFLELGSNLGRRRENLARGRRHLRDAGIRILRASSVYRTQPVGYAHQPWFYNQVLEVDAPFSASDLLPAVKDIERAMKRKPTFRNGPRIIDIDILLQGRSIVRSERLKLPHPELARRNFVLVPLSEIAPEAIHPTTGLSIAELAARSRDRSIVRRVGPGRKTRRASRPARRKRL